MDPKQLLESQKYLKKSQKKIIVLITEEKNPDGDFSNGDKSFSAE